MRLRRHRRSSRPRAPVPERVRAMPAAALLFSLSALLAACAGNRVPLGGPGTHCQSGPVHGTQCYVTTPGEPPVDPRPPGPGPTAEPKVLPR